MTSRIGVRVPSVGLEGWTEAQARLNDFLARGVSRYGVERNHPDQRDGSSGLSPYLHFGHISSVQIVSDILELEGDAPHPGMDKLMGNALAGGDCPRVQNRI